MTQYSPDRPSLEVHVTIIVPVFNTGPELIRRAVVSALNQTHADLELLIVDDGSSPDVASFLDTIAERDFRIRVLHTANGGVSSARNIGVENARGQFIAYLDADDYLEPQFLSSALYAARITGADAVFGGIRILHERGAVDWRAGGPPASAPLIGTPEIIINACTSALSDSPSPHYSTQVLSVTNVVSALYRKDTAEGHRFREGMTHAEDRLYNLSLILASSRTAFCSDVWYVYDQTHGQGVTSRATPQMVRALARTVREFADVSRAFQSRFDLTDDARNQISQAAADGVLNYLKVLTGVTAVVGNESTNHAVLRALLNEQPVRIAVASAAQTTWKNRIFAAAANHGNLRVLNLLGRLWVRGGGLGISSASSVAQSVEGKS